jgi:hypothetical protein
MVMQHADGSLSVFVLGTLADGVNERTKMLTAKKRDRNRVVAVKS